MDGKIVGKVADAPSFYELEMWADRTGKDLKTVMAWEEQKVYVARKKEEGRNWQYFLVRNPALMVWQAYNRAEKIIRQKPEPVQAGDVAQFFDQVEEVQTKKTKKDMGW